MDSDNQVIIDIFNYIGNKFLEIDLDITDDEDSLIDLFGLVGFDAIRDAEQGIYTKMIQE